MDKQVEQKVTQAFDLVHKAHEQLYDVWITDILFTWRWWVGMALTIIPIITWILFRKKESTDRLLYVGLFVALFSSFFDMVGVSLGLWSYPQEVIPLMPAFLTWDIGIYPITVMFFLQYKPHFSPLIKGVIFSAIGAFIVQPIFTLMKLYDPEVWKHYYSFPIFLVIYLASNYLVSRDKFEKL